jgi:hypothetical protein
MRWPQFAMKQTSLVIIVLSLLSILYSFSLSAYTNDAEYHEKYLAIDWQELGSSVASSQFFELRNDYLSNKYSLQDYGFTFLIIGTAVFIFFRKGQAVYTPSSVLKLVLVGLCAALLTIGAFVGDLFLEFFRGAYPWWADSLGIPLMGLPMLAFLILAWVALNLLALNGHYKSSVPITFKQLKNSSYFYLTLSVLTSLIVFLCILDGFFWLVLPGVFWLYFYTSLWAGRRSISDSKQQ